MEESCLRNQNRAWMATAQAENEFEITDERGPVAGSCAVTLQHETIQGIPVLRCSGRIVYGPDSESLFESIRKMLQTFPNLILDFRHITTIDAKGIGALLTLHALARAKNGSIWLVHVGQPVERVLRITNLFGLFQLYGSEVLAAQAR